MIFFDQDSPLFTLESAPKRRFWSIALMLSAIGGQPALPARSDSWTPTAHRAGVTLRAQESSLGEVPDGEVVEGTVSPNGQRVVLRVRQGPNERLFVDGQAQPAYSQIAPQSVIWSPDSRHLAYVAAHQGKVIMVRDGQESAHYDAIAKGSATWSADNRRLAFGAVRAGKNVVVLDGQEQEAFDGVAQGPLSFSPDGRRLAFAASRGQKWVVVVDGEPGHEFDGIGAGGITSGAASNGVDADALVWSADGRHLAYVAARGEGMLIVADGTQSALYDNFVPGSILRFEAPNRLLILSTLR